MNQEAPDAQCSAHGKQAFIFGRRVYCANCGHLMFEEPPVAASSSGSPGESREGSTT